MKFLFFLLSLPSFALAKPNVIYVLADDLGYGDLSCYGQEKFTTPNLDRLATEGMKFTNHYSGNTVCSPSRAVLMTGIESGKCYLRGNVPGEENAALPTELVTVPEIFQAAGYRTGAFGKWGLGRTHQEGAENPLHHGFDEFLGWKSQTIAHTYYPSSYVHNGREIPLAEGTYLHPLVMKAARDFIASSAEAGEPFFCYLPTAIPHAAMHAPPELHEKWRKVFPQFDQRIGKYGAGPTESAPDVVNPIAGFAAMMEHLDNEVGAILALLERLDIDDETLIFFASDNGAHREGGHDPEFFNSTGGLRGHKRDMHEGGIRSPFLARWPGHIAAGSSSDHLSGFHDLLPTICELLDTDIPAQNTGLSFLPTLTGQGQQEKHDYLHIEFTQGLAQKRHSQALRFGPWKAYRRAGKALELYHLGNDPFEENDLASDPGQREIVSKARQLLDIASAPLAP
ncbi:arylsulfatase [Roseibacillus ishigakijimensis]|uniref:Arylsulfatase n=1 Tax=Roseibacillus ishigakijimensis TaxID=454146 RepID=A0A934RSW3_9BACT|nr:arylsulfatase [Roseibacillus ishigakijimensis]MBK1834444.1 arylsulfatase [Roseibacillus ishigakijimensis]